MGLDQFAWRVKAEDAIGNFEIAKEEDGSGSKVEEFFHWLKHHDLHGWFERLYRNKGGPAESFNCIPVRLTTVDLDALQHDLLNGTLPETTGFFFGNQEYDEYYFEDLKYTKTLIENLLSNDELMKNWYLEYSSSW